jgi:hypothetical protein
MSAEHRGVSHAQDARDHTFIASTQKNTTRRRVPFRSTQRRIVWWLVHGLERISL